MDLLPALLLVAGSYLSLWLIQRRVRAWLGRRDAPQLAVFERYDHEALRQGLLALAVEGAGPELSVGRGEALPPRGEALDSRQGVPAELREARDLLLAGSFPLAAARAAGQSSPQAIRSLFVRAFLVRLRAGEFEAAEEAALSLPDAVPDAEALSRALLAWVEARRAERLGRGKGRVEAAERGLAHVEASEGCLDADPAWAGLGVHLELLRFSLGLLEWSEWRVRRRLRRLMALHPESACPHFLQAHLSARLGDGNWGDHLARALYHARGNPFYAQPILAAPRLATLRPGLVAEARTLSERSVGPQVDT